MASFKATLKPLLIASFILGGASAVSAAEIVLKAITYIPPSKVEDSMTVFKMWVGKVNEAAKGELRIDILGGPDVFPVNDQVNALSKGLADIVMTFTAHTALVPEMDTTGISEITPDEERKVGYFELLDKAHNKINVKLIGRTATTSGFFIFSKEPIQKLADFKNLKIRSHSGYDPFFKKLGANPIGMSISEIYGGLERGIVTAAPYNIFIYDLGMHDVTKYVLADAFWPSHTTVTLMNLKKFNSLSPKLQDILANAQLEVEKEMPGIIADMIKTERGKLEAEGMVFTHLSPEEVKEFRQMANDSRWEVLATKLDPARLEKIKGMITK
ncbi:TRAP transporter substrate-binding protein DctP [Microvirga sp. M2]|uniref:TRAP transporter substrate-binding protein DctP n=1 Tax=Microvirga sp. M2 TaxID=3073270 RepID=UPI0039C4A1C7